MLENAFSPLTDWGLLVLRLGAGVVFLAHGLLKVRSPGGAGGLAGWLKQIGVPAPGFLAWVVIVLETAGAILLMLGLGTRILALGFAIDMLVALFLVKRKVMKIGFIGMQGTGWELDFVMLAQVVALMLTGAGGLALDPAVGL